MKNTFKALRDKVNYVADGLNNLAKTPIIAIIMIGDERFESSKIDIGYSNDKVAIFIDVKKG